MIGKPVRYLLSAMVLIFLYCLIIAYTEYKRSQALSLFDRCSSSEAFITRMQDKTNFNLLSADLRDLRITNQNFEIDSLEREISHLPHGSPEIASVNERLRELRTSSDEMTFQNLEARSNFALDYDLVQDGQATFDSSGCNDVSSIVNGLSFLLSVLYIVLTFIFFGLGVMVDPAILVRAHSNRSSS